MQNIKKLLSLTMVFILCISLCSCQKTKEVEELAAIETKAIAQTATTTRKIEPIVTKIVEPVVPITVSEHAIVDYLLPIEEFSWEREYKPEMVMLHFSSAIMRHWDDPYNVEYVRDTYIEYDVSTHYIIERDGTIRCYIPEDRVAWHAGKNEYPKNDKYSNCMNLYSIGIELIAIGSENDMSVFMHPDTYAKIDESLIGYTEEQYNALKLLVQDICERYEIPMDKDHIIGHDEYCDEKTDPGELFNWNRIIEVN